MELENGKTYLVNHKRKGVFTLTVESQSNGFIHGTITGGEAAAMMEYNIKHEGENISFRKGFIIEAVEQRIVIHRGLT